MIVRFVAQAVKRSLDIYLKTLKPTSQSRENYLLLSKLARAHPTQQNI